MLTELEAVNDMLATIREAPVSSLLDPKPEEVSLALNTLRKVSKDVQAIGWAFNIEIDRTFSQDDDGIVTIPEDVLTVEQHPCTITDSVKLVLRGRTFYDAKAQTDEIDADVRCSKVVVLLEWDDIPEIAQRYIAMRAARIFNWRVLGSESIEPPASIEERRAERELRRQHGTFTKPNMLRSPGVVNILSGHNG